MKEIIGQVYSIGKENPPVPGCTISKEVKEHPEIARQYESLKLDLWKKYEHNRDAYTDAKTAFIRKWTKEARSVFKDR